MPPPGSLSLAWQDFFIVLAALLGVGILTFGWVVFFRNKGPRLHRPHRRRRRSYRQQFREGTHELKQLVKNRRERRRRRRQLNPSLAETGGLPPVHPDDREKPGAPPPPPS